MSATTTRVGYGIVRSLDPERRVLEAVLSHQKVDATGEVVQISGIDRSRAASNMPMLEDHDLAKPIGQWDRLWTATLEGVPALLGRGIGTPPGISPIADQCWAEIRAGIRRGVSISFTSEERGGPILPGQKGITHVRSHLLEGSIVMVPACAQCLVTAKSACACSTHSRRAEDILQLSDETILTLDDEDVGLTAGEVRAAIRSQLDVATWALRGKLDGMRSQLAPWRGR